MLRALLLFTCLFSAALSTRAAEIRYVTDEFEITMRSGTSTANQIVRMLRSGEAVNVLEADLVSQYSLIETEDGKSGYVLSRFLMVDPAARETLAQLRVQQEQQQVLLVDQDSEIVELKQSLEQEQTDNEALKAALRASEQELSQVRDTAKNTLNILEQNKRLQTVVDELREEKTALSDANAELSDSTQIDWFVRGAAVSLIAFIIGILVTRIRWRKQESWGSY